MSNNVVNRIVHLHVGYRSRFAPFTRFANVTKLRVNGLSSFGWRELSSLTSLLHLITSDATDVASMTRAVPHLLTLTGYVKHGSLTQIVSDRTVFPVLRCLCVRCVRKSVDWKVVIRSTQTII